jgi:hypothetical protein
MTNDILEQITDDYFRERGYFTQHNIPYRPNTFKQTPSDIDVMGVHPTKTGIDKVAVISCKSWQSGMNITKLLRDLTDNPNKKIQGKEREKLFREIASKDWSEALINEVYKLTGQKTFTFYISATHITGNRSDWEEFEMFKKNLPECKIKLLSLEDIIVDLASQKRDTKMPLHSQLSRLLQLIDSAGGKIVFKP